jgi:hypothetical protein
MIRMGKYIEAGLLFLNIFASAIFYALGDYARAACHIGVSVFIVVRGVKS